MDICADTAPLACVTRCDTARNRVERRVVTTFDPARRLASSDWQPHVAAIVRIERDVLTRSARTGLWSRSTHTATYIANTAISAAQAAHAIRAHWTIENTSHYTRDVTLGEDRSRIRTNPGVFVRLRSFAYNILKANQTHGTISQDRYRAALGGLESLLNLLAIQKR